MGFITGMGEKPSGGRDFLGRKRDQSKGGKGIDVDAALEVGASFDWITPAYSMAREFLTGGRGVMIDKNTYGLYDVERCFKHHGQKVWGATVTGNQVIFSTDAKHTTELILRELTTGTRWLR